MVYLGISFVIIFKIENGKWGMLKFVIIKKLVVVFKVFYENLMVVVGYIWVFLEEICEVLESY